MNSVCTNFCQIKKSPTEIPGIPEGERVSWEKEGSPHDLVEEADAGDVGGAAGGEGLDHDALLPPDAIEPQVRPEEIPGHGTGKGGGPVSMLFIQGLNRGRANLLSACQTTAAFGHHTRDLLFSCCKNLLLLNPFFSDPLPQKN